MNRPIIYFRYHYSFGRCKFYALWLKRKELKRNFTRFFFHGVVGNCLNEMKLTWNKFLDFSSVWWLWRNLFKMNMNGRIFRNAAIVCACIIQICLAYFNEINSILFNIFSIEDWWFFFFFEQAQLYWSKNIIFLILCTLNMSLWIKRYTQDKKVTATEK